MKLLLKDLFQDNTILLSNIFGGNNMHGYLLGASGSVMAIVVAIAVLIPDYVVNLMFIGPVRLKYVALASFIFTTLLDLNVNTGGKIAHLGGAFFGLMYTIQYKKGTFSEEKAGEDFFTLDYLIERKPVLASTLQ